MKTEKIASAAADYANSVQGDGYLTVEEWGYAREGYIKGAEYAHHSAMEIVCSFCGDDGFDQPGLKHHLNNYCKVYPKIESI